MSDSERDIRTPIFVKILKSCVNGATKQKILKEAAPLTHEQLRRITAELVDRELLRYVDVNRVYITTDKGHQFLNQNRNLKDAD
jgi:predicted transcriptional regulator